MNFRLLAAATAFLFLGSCTTTENAKKIVGDWKGAVWLVDGQPSGNDVAGTAFHFAEDGNYSYTYSGSVERGLYKVYENKLYTTPTGGQEIAVDIRTVTNDSLVFDMNRSGKAETLILVRK